MRVNTWHACCAIRCGSRFIWKSCDCNYSPTITMPFDVFIFSTLVGNVLSGILHFNICAPRSSILQKYRPVKLALPNRESAIEFRGIVIPSVCGARITYLARNHESRWFQSLHLPVAISSNILYFDIYVVIFHPADAAKKIDIIELHAASVVCYNGPAHTSYSISHSSTYENISGCVLFTHARHTVPL